MISKNMEKALNQQLNFELFSAYQYAACASHLERESLNGFTHWMKMQAQEELAHAAKFYNYIMDVGGHVAFTQIDAPKCEFTSVLNVFENVLEHEQEVSKEIHKLVDLALKENDHPTHQFLQWFVSEQVEEEKVAEDIVQQLRMIGDNANGLFMMDRELAQRSASATPAYT